MSLTAEATEWLMAHLNTIFPSSSPISAKRQVAFVKTLLSAAAKSVCSSCASCRSFCLPHALVSVPPGLVVLDVKELELLSRSSRPEGSTELHASDSPLVTVSDAFSMPKWTFLPTRKTFEKGGGAPALHSAAVRKTEMFRQRYSLIHQRMLRHEIFQHAGTTNAGTPQQLTQIESLHGSSGMKCVLGMISQIEEGKYFLEDLDASVQVDLSGLNEESTQGLFTENSIVLCDGYMSATSDSYCVTRMALPPAEPRIQTIRTFPNIDFFGDGADTEPSTRSRIQLAEARLKSQNIRNFILVLADLWLDDPVVCKNLQTTLLGVQQMISPSHQLIAVVCMGNFLSPKSRGDLEQFGTSFTRLGEIFFPRGSRSALPPGCQLIFVPGPADPSPAPDCLPRPRLMTPVQEAFFSAASATSQRDRVHFVSNPCRLRYLSKEIVVFREDVSSRMRRHSVVSPPSHAAENFVGLLVRTLLDQSHLCPLPLPLQPALWDFDHALRLYPLPDALILGESFAKYAFSHESCNVFNSGSFSTDGSFAFFYPETGESDIVQVNTN